MKLSKQQGTGVMENPFNIFRKPQAKLKESFKPLKELSNLLLAIGNIEENFPIEKETAKDWLAFSKMLNALADELKSKARIANNSQ